jgi:hypothetical protein
MSTPTYVSISGLIETPQSGGWEIGAVRRRIQEYVGKLATCEAQAPWRGSLGTGEYAGWLVDSVLITPDRGGMATMQIRYTAGMGSGQELPADEWSVQSFEDNPRLERHQRYATLTSAQRADVQTAVQALTEEDRDAAYSGLAALGQELVDKIRLGQESYYRPGRRYVWTSYSYSPPFAVDGGLIELPGGPGAAYLNNNYSWLRLADDLEYVNGTYRITSTWLGAPDGYWDKDIYTS